MQKRDTQFKPLVKITRKDKDGNDYSKWYLFWNDKNGRRKSKLIDIDHKLIPITDIRKRAVSLWNEIQNGTYELENQSKQKTFQYLFESYCNRIEKEGAKTIKKIKQLYDKDLKKDLGNLFLNEISTEIVNKVFEKISDRSIYQANKALSILKASFNFGMQRGLIKINPAASLNKFEELPRERYYSEEEKDKIILELMTRWKNNSSLQHSVIFILLLIATGRRKSEIANAKWKHLQNGVIILEDHKTKRKTKKIDFIVLSEFAINLINTLPRKNDEDFILNVRNPKNLWNSVRKTCGCEDLRLHDLRHSYASIGLNSKKMSVLEVATLLGHKSSASSKRYMHTFKETSVENTNTINELIFNKPEYVTYLQQNAS